MLDILLHFLLLRSAHSELALPSSSFANTLLLLLLRTTAKTEALVNVEAVELLEDKMGIQDQLVRGLCSFLPPRRSRSLIRKFVSADPVLRLLRIRDLRCYSSRSLWYQLLCVLAVEPLRERSRPPL